MRYSHIDCLGMEISRMGIGGAQFGMDYGLHKELTQQEVESVLETAWKRGINFIDTARDYQRSEEKIGNFIKAHPECRFVIATKIARIDPVKAKDNTYLKDHIQKSVEASLRLLNLQTIDILQLHQCEDQLLENPVLERIIADLRRQKKIKSFGISIYEPPEAQRILKRNGAVNFIQLPYNVFDQRFESLLEQFSRQGIQVISRSALLKGVIPLSNDSLPHDLDELREYKLRLQEFSAQSGRDPSELALLFVFLNPWIATTIIGIRQVQEIIRNADLLENGKTEAPVRELINRLRVDDPRCLDPRRWTGMPA